MKKLLFAFMLGVFAIFALPSCSTDTGSAAVDKLAGMELTKDNAAEFVETFSAAIDDINKAIEAKDEAKVKEMLNAIAPVMDKATESDALDDSQKMTIGLKILGLAEAADKAGIKLE